MQPLSKMRVNRLLSQMEHMISILRLIPLITIITQLRLGINRQMASILLSRLNLGRIPMAQHLMKGLTIILPIERNPTLTTILLISIKYLPLSRQIVVSSLSLI